MVPARWGNVLQYLRQVTAPHDLEDVDDDQLLERFVARRDEAAFAALVRRHGPLVMGVCRRVLHHEHDAEDAFQAAFLVLARKAASIVRRESVGSWLYGVAVRVARKARTVTARRQKRERPLEDMPAADVEPQFLWQEVGRVLDEEVHRLPTQYRVPFVLCYLQGKTFAEAARQLGCPLGTVATRLARARERLRFRLSRRGLALPTGLTAALLSAQATAAVPASLVEGTVQAAFLFTAGRVAVSGALSLSAAALAKGVLQTMWMSKLKMAVAVLLTLGMVGSGTGVVSYRLQAAGEANDPQQVGVPGQGQKPTESPEDKLRRDNALLRNELRVSKDKMDELQKQLQDLKQFLGQGQKPQESPEDKLRRENALLRRELHDLKDKMEVLQKELQDLKQFLAKDLYRQSIRDAERIWNEDRLVRPAWQGHTGAVLAVAFAPDGRRVASGGADQVVRLWDPATGKTVDTLKGPTQAIHSLAFSPDGRLLAAGSADGSALVWDAATGRLVTSLQGGHGPVESVAFSPDGHRLLVAGRVIRLLDLPSGKEFWRINGSEAKVKQARFSPDGRLVLYGRMDIVLGLVDAATGKEIRRLMGHQGGIQAVAFTPDGKLVASGGADKTVRVWDLATGKVIMVLKGQGGPVTAVAFSPDGRTLLAGGEDNELRLWDTQTGMLRGRMQGHTAGVTAVAVAPDGRTVVTGSKDKTVRLWDLLPAKKDGGENLNRE